MSCEQKNPVIGIIMGSESDLPAMEPCMKQLDEFGVPYEVKVASAHRKPAEVHEWASKAHERGIRVIIAAAGKAAHLGGVVAAYTPNPVITVPMKTSDLGGLDSLLSMVQMPSGVPVACVAINGAKNAAILAVQIMGTGCDGARQKIIDLQAGHGRRVNGAVRGGKIAGRRIEEDAADCRAPSCSACRRYGALVTLWRCARPCAA